jgi:predicted Zn-dependent protease
MDTTSQPARAAPHGHTDWAVAFRRGRVQFEEVELKTAKDEVRELLQNLPDDASLEDIQYHLYVRQKIQKGLAAAEQGRTIPHEEVVRRMSRWLEK